MAFSFFFGFAGRLEGTMVPGGGGTKVRAGGFDPRGALWIENGVRSERGVTMATYSGFGGWRMVPAGAAGCEMLGGGFCWELEVSGDRRLTGEAERE